MQTVCIRSSGQRLGQMADKHMKRCSAPLVIREVHIETMQRHYSLPDVDGDRPHQVLPRAEDS